MAEFEEGVSFEGNTEPWKPSGRGGRRSEPFAKRGLKVHEGGVPAYMPVGLPTQGYYNDKEQVAARKLAREKADMKRITEKPFVPPSRASSYKNDPANGKVGADLGVMNSMAQTSVMMHPRNIHNTSFPTESGIKRVAS